MPCGSKTRWSLTQTESNPYSSAFFDPSMQLSAEAYSQKCGNSKPNFNFVAMSLLLIFLFQLKKITSIFTGALSMSRLRVVVQSNFNLAKNAGTPLCVPSFLAVIEKRL